MFRSAGLLAPETSNLNVRMQVTENKQRISELKGAIEQRRVQRSMAGLTDPAAALAAQQPDAGEESAKAQIEQVRPRGKHGSSASLASHQKA